MATPKPVTHFRFNPKFPDCRIGRPAGAEYPDQSEPTQTVSGFVFHLKGKAIHHDPAGVQFDVLTKNSDRYHVFCSQSTAAKALGYRGVEDPNFLNDPARTERGFRGAARVLQALSEKETDALKTPDGVITKDEWLEVSKAASETKDAKEAAAASADRARMAESARRDAEAHADAMSKENAALRKQLEGKLK